MIQILINPIELSLYFNSFGNLQVYLINKFIIVVMLVIIQQNLFIIALRNL